MGGYLFRNMALLDPAKGEVAAGCQVLVKDGNIAQVEAGEIAAGDATVVDMGGRTLMPGLIDCHNHIIHKRYPHLHMLSSIASAKAAKTLRAMLMRGFTTVRDAGGADAGHRQAVDEGYFIGPRLLVCGRPISQSGGHGDKRLVGDLNDPCFCAHLGPGTGRIADGVPECLKAVREEIRLGADQIKVHASGGVASETDPIDMLQFSMDELKALVDEATRSHTYVLTHTYPADAIKRCVEAGVRTIEHGNFLDEDAAAMMARAGTYLVPTLVIYREMAEHGRERGFSEASLQKCDYVMEVGARSLEIAARAGVKVGFGSDVGNCPDAQSREFLVRGEAQKPADIIRSATTISAEVVRLKGKIGVIAAGAYADLIAVDGNPLEDIALLSGQGENIPFVMKAGKVYKDRLGGGEG